MWGRWCFAQAISILAGIAGKLLLWIPCALKFWHKDFGFDDRPIDVWNWVWMNKLWGNPEDGVSGKQALIWNSSGVRVPYRPNASDFVRSYVWSAWRNSADNLKYVFAYGPGYLVTFSVFGLKLKAGYQMENGFNVPIFGRA